jgi:hypothetical protein
VGVTQSALGTVAVQVENRTIGAQAIRNEQLSWDLKLLNVVNHLPQYYNILQSMGGQNQIPSGCLWQPEWILHDSKIALVCQAPQRSTNLPCQS